MNGIFFFNNAVILTPSFPVNCIDGFDDPYLLCEIEDGSFRINTLDFVHQKHKRVFMSRKEAEEEIARDWFLASLSFFLCFQLDMIFFSLQTVLMSLSRARSICQKLSQHFFLTVLNNARQRQQQWW